MRLSRLLLASVASLLALAPSDAQACGGCFAPPNPTGTVSVVNAHRMAFLASPVESVLWDQIVYTGNPSDFVWVLPVMGNPTVEVADNGFFEALTVATTITMVAPAPPPTQCPDPCAAYSASFGCGGAATARFAAAAADAGALADADVNVLHQGVVGPYETATVMSNDPMALENWLAAHGYEVPDAIRPTIAYYVGLGMSFVALRLRPMVGVDRMAPIRIRSPGLSLTLPLRMIAAGIGESVDLELFVFAEARMQTANFPNSEVDRTAITYDWASNTFDYDARFEDALFSGTGTQTNWVTEFAQVPFVASLEAYRSGVGTDAHSAAVDTTIVTRALPVPYLTRLRTRLTKEELAADLTLGLSTGGDLGTYVSVTRELHRRELICDTYCPNDGDGIDPGGSSTRGAGSSSRCSASRGLRGSPIVLATFACVVIGLGWRRRKR
jgi:hypothetical protein